MKKTLILVVDRDDDFGAKGNVSTPAIGIFACADAAAALGTADPEDSDINALFAAMNIYRDMESTDEPGSFEVALICGDQKVGHRSDQALIGELDRVLERVKPDCAILVGDGAEDEYTYPIISSRVPINSVRKVFVKQAPSVEGTFYVIAKYLNDPQKKERFLAPIAWAIILIAFVYVAVAYFRDGGDFSDILLSNTTTFIVLIVGVMLLFMAYSVTERMREAFRVWSDRARRGSLTVVFLVAAIVFALIGLIIGVYVVGEMYTTSLAEKFVIFCSNALWLLLFAIMLYMLGGLVDRYVNFDAVKYSFITGILNIVAVGLILTGALDFAAGVMDIYSTANAVIAVEFVFGFALAVFAAINQFRVRRILARSRGNAGKAR